jgi:hypothetical protein
MLCPQPRTLAGLVAAKLRIRPHHHLVTPCTVNFACRVNPRVIDDSAWLKLIWASLNIEQQDVLSEIHYPLAMIKAMAVVWTHAGLRCNEIGRLAVGCARSQNDDILNDDGSRVPAGTLCYLRVPVGHERSFAWAARFRRLARDYERLDTILKGPHLPAFATLMLRNLANIISTSS